MDRWYSLQKGAPRMIACAGDSYADWRQSGNISYDGYVDILRAHATARWGDRGDGTIMMHRNQDGDPLYFGAGEWTIGSSWFQVDISNENDDMVHGQNYGHLGSTSTAASELLTVDVSAFTVDAFDLIYQNVTFGTTPSYRIDAGSWVNMPTSTGLNDMAVLHVASPVTSTIDIRPSNAAGSVATICGIDGVRLYKTTQNNRGVIVDNLGVGGATLDDFVRPTSGGSPFSWFDQYRPNLVIGGLWANDWDPDILAYDPEGFDTNLRTFITHISDYADYMQVIAPMLNWESRTFETQKQYRTIVRKVCADFNAPVVDLQERWGTYQQATSADYMSYFNDGLHPSEAGFADLGLAVWNVVASSGQGAWRRLS